MGLVRRAADHGVLELLDRAAAEGATSIGGLDPASIDRDPVGQLDALFEIAARRGVGIDIHLHDRGDLGAFQYELIAERTLQAGLQGKVNVSHGFRTDEDLTYAVELATTYGAGFVHRENHGLTPGARADIVLLDAENAPDVLVRAPRREVVIAGGQVVVRDGELQI